MVGASANAQEYCPDHQSVQWQVGPTIRQRRRALMRKRFLFGSLRLGCDSVPRKRPTSRSSRLSHRLWPPLETTREQTASSLRHRDAYVQTAAHCRCPRRRGYLVTTSLRSPPNRGTTVGSTGDVRTCNPFSTGIGSGTVESTACSICAATRIAYWPGAGLGGLRFLSQLASSIADCPYRSTASVASERHDL